jgi:S-adenosylhomocysteine hydrolase
VSGTRSHTKAIARLKLAGMGVNVDALTREQEQYLAS